MTNQTESIETEASTDLAGQNERVVMPNFEFWAILECHELKEDMWGIGIINGLHYSELDEIHDALKEEILESFDVEKDFPPNCSIDFIAKNVSHQEGQMSFPETGQWDFPPHYEMDISVIKINPFPDEA